MPSKSGRDVLCAECGGSTFMAQFAKNPYELDPERQTRLGQEVRLICCDCRTEISFRPKQSRMDLEMSNGVLRSERSQ